MTVILELKDVTKAYDEFKVVDRFNFKVMQGELRCLLGPNGAGKTTTIDLITGRQKATSGTILFDGDDITGLREDKIAKLGVGRKFQVPAVFKDLTVRDNIQVAYSKNTDPFFNMIQFGRKEGRERQQQVVELVGLQDRLDEMGGNLSHGETQWLEIGMVLTQNPKLLLMDEPTAHLDISARMTILEIVKRYSEQAGVTVISVLHDINLAAAFFDRVLILSAGEVIADGSSGETLTDKIIERAYNWPVTTMNIGERKIIIPKRAKGEI